MIVFISYYTEDKPQMVRWSNHVKKLGGASKHHIIVMPAHGATTDGVMEPLSEAFGKAEVLECFHAETGWPVSCNRAFERAAWHSYQVTKQSFLWMEPDATPLKSSWLDEIEAEYRDCGKPFMGDFVKIAGVLPNGVDHMSGIAVYHWNMPVLAPSVFNNDHAAWDIVSGRDVVPKMHKTSLIQHDWVPEKKWRRDVVTKDCVKPLAAIYHPDKLGVLFDDSLAGSLSSVQGDPVTGGGGASTSFNHRESAPLLSGVSEIKKFLASEKPIEECHSVIDALFILLDNHKNLKKVVIKRLNEKGIIKSHQTKKRKHPRKKVKNAVVSS